VITVHTSADQHKAHGVLALISDLTRIRRISGRTAPSAGLIVYARAERAAGSQAPARTTSLAVSGASSNTTLPLWDWQGCTAMPLGVGHSLDVRQWVCHEEGRSDLVGGFG
jgi:hypothetical protein